LKFPSDQQNIKEIKNITSHAYQLIIKILNWTFSFNNLLIRISPLNGDFMKSKSMDEHKKRAPESVNGAVITLSDSKYRDFLRFRKMESNDISGKLIKDALKEKDKVVFYSVIPDDASLLLSTINHVIETYDVDVIITTGGTGIGPRDITIETLKGVFDKELNGFGEIFRYESYKELGTGAILSRAAAGVYKGKLIVSMPGSPNAVTLALKIILPELGHLIKHLKE